MHKRWTGQLQDRGEGGSMLERGRDSDGGKKERRTEGGRADDQSYLKAVETQLTKTPFSRYLSESPSSDNCGFGFRRAADFCRHSLNQIPPTPQALPVAGFGRLEKKIFIDWGDKKGTFPNKRQISGPWGLPTPQSVRIHGSGSAQIFIHPNGHPGVVVQANFTHGGPPPCTIVPVPSHFSFPRLGKFTGEFVVAVSLGGG